MTDGTGLTGLLSKSPELLKEIYGDLAKPGMQNLGKAIGGIIGLGNTALISIHLMNEKGRIYLEKNFESLRLESLNVPTDEVIEVAPEIGVPILEKLTYISNDEISHLYINLLTKASSKRYVDQAHPSFPKIIDSMSPDEASFLNGISEFVRIPFIDINLELSSGGYNILEELIIDEKYKKNIIYPENTPAYISNFSSLGILDVSRSTYMQAADIHYEPLWIKSKEKHESHAKKTNRKLAYSKGKVSITPLGSLFIKACLTKLK